MGHTKKKLEQSKLVTQQGNLQILWLDIQVHCSFTKNQTNQTKINSEALELLRGTVLT